MKKSCTVVQHPPDSPQRYLPLVDLLVDTRTKRLELAMRSGLRVFTAMLEEDRAAFCGTPLPMRYITPRCHWACASPAFAVTRRAAISGVSVETVCAGSGTEEDCLHATPLTSSTASIPPSSLRVFSIRRA